MRWHICLYLDDQEILNINDVYLIEWFDDYLYIGAEHDNYIFDFDEFNNFKVDIIK